MGAMKDATWRYFCGALAIAADGRGRGLTGTAWKRGGEDPLRHEEKTAKIPTKTQGTWPPLICTSDVKKGKGAHDFRGYKRYNRMRDTGKKKFELRRAKKGKQGGLRREKKRRPSEDLNRHR